MKRSEYIKRKKLRRMCPDWPEDLIRSPFGKLALYSDNQEYSFTGTCGVIVLDKQDGKIKKLEV